MGAITTMTWNLGKRRPIPEDALLQLLIAAQAGYENIYGQRGYDDPSAAFQSLLGLITQNKIAPYIAGWNDPAVQNPPNYPPNMFYVGGRYKEAGETDMFVDKLEPTAEAIKRFDRNWRLGSEPSYEQQVLEGDWGGWGTYEGSRDTGIPLSIHGPLWIGKNVFDDYEKTSIGVPWLPDTAAPTGQEALDVGYTPNIAMFSYMGDTPNSEWEDTWREQRKISESAVANMDPDSIFIKEQPGYLPFIDPERWEKLDETDEEATDRIWGNIQSLLHETTHVDPITGYPITHGDALDIEGGDDILMEALKKYSEEQGMDIADLYRALGFILD